MTLALPVLYFIDVVVYEVQGRTGIDPPLDWSVLEVCDILWMVCLALSTRMAVQEPPIRITREVLSWDEIREIEDGNGDTGLGDNGLVLQARDEAADRKLMV